MTKKQQIEFLKRRNDYLEQELDRTKKETQRILTETLNINRITALGLDYLFEDTLPFASALIFDITKEYPLTDLPTFDSWFATLTREDFTEGLMDDEDVAKFLDNLPLGDIRNMFREPARNFYIKKHKEYIKRCELIIADSLARQLKKK